VRIVRALYAASAALALLGLWLELAPASPPHAPEGERARAAWLGPAPTARAALPNYEAIVAANIFSKVRTPSAARFTPAGSPRNRQARGAARGGTPLTLYGITMGPQGAVALIHADPSVPGADVYHLGDLVAGGRLVAITESTVTLARPSGPLVLHLPARRRAKS
jgi:hypothetical protein